MQADSKPAERTGSDPTGLEARLMQRGLISERELSEARTAAGRRNAPLEEALVGLGFLTEDQVGMLQAEALGVSYVFPHAEDIPPDLVARFPPEALKQHLAVPLLMEEDRIVMATPNAADPETRRQLEGHCGCGIVLSLASKRKIERVLEKLFPAGAGKTPLQSRDPGAVSFLYSHLAWALGAKASEIRFESDQETVRVRYRIGGRLEERGTEPLAVMFPLMARLRTLFGTLLRPRAAGATGVLRTRIGSSEYRLDLSVLATRLGECALLKLVPERPASPAESKALLTDESVSSVVNKILIRKGLVLVSSASEDVARALSYEMLERTNPGGRTIVTLEPSAWELRPSFRQVETTGLRLADALEAALSYEPEVVYVGHPLQWPGEVAATLMSATSRLVLVSTSDSSALEAVLRWLDCGAPAWLLSRVLEAMITVHGGREVSVIEPSPELRRAMERRATPQEIREAAPGRQRS